MLTVEQKIEHLRKLGLNGNMTEIEKMYSGREFNIEPYIGATLHYNKTARLTFSF